MDRTFICKIQCRQIPIRIVEQDIALDAEYKSELIFNCSYRVDDEKEFKFLTGYDITNAIHRNKIEIQLAVFLSNIIQNAFVNHEVGKLTYRQVQECDVDIQDEINHKVKKFHLIKSGFDIVEIELKEIKLSSSTKKEIEEKIKLQKHFSAVKNMEVELKILMPEFIDEKADEKNIPWTCSCGSINKTPYCPNCGAKKEDEKNKIVLTL